MELQTTQYTLTRDEVITTIRRHKGSIFICVQQEAPIKGEEGKVFPICGSLVVSKKVAKKFILNSYSDVLVGRGAMVQVRVLKYPEDVRSSLFIG